MIASKSSFLKPEDDKIERISSVTKKGSPLTGNS